MLKEVSKFHLISEGFCPYCQTSLNRGTIVTDLAYCKECHLLMSLKIALRSQDKICLVIDTYEIINLDNIRWNSSISYRKLDISENYESDLTPN